jgi:hypothetical protein
MWGSVPVWHRDQLQKGNISLTVKAVTGKSSKVHRAVKDVKNSKLEEKGGKFI